MLPTLTHLQFLIIGICLDGERAGREIREELAKQKVRKSGPAFYQLMARLEDDGFVKGWYEQKVIDGQVIKERRYKLTAGGHRAYERTCAFYAENAGGMLGRLLGGLARA